MKLRYFVVDEANDLHRIRRSAVEAVWSDARPVASLGLRLADDLRVVTVVCDPDLHPRICFFLRVDLEDGRITDDSRLRAHEAVEVSNRGELDHPAVAHQLGRWPSDWRRQLAVALDVPVAEVNNIGIGGLLPLADVLGIPMPRLMGYFADAL